MWVLSMRKTEAHRDEYGLFVREDGNIYRPAESKDSYPVKGGITKKSSFRKGHIVYVRRLPQTPFCIVCTNRDNEETYEMWSSHGCHMNRSEERRVGKECRSR